MDIKNEVEVKIEVLAITEEDKTTNVPLDQVSTLEEIKERNYEFIDMKSEIEVKEEHLATEEEITSNDKLFDQNYLLDQNQ
ncbi:hypothetical protein Avbf_16230, partial [Armadillidium vulgare]